MLDSLHIGNIAVIKECDVDFSPGFTVITGQTGAGKSVFLGALALALGGRNRRDLLRTGEEQANVSAVFSDVSGRLGDDFSPDENGELYVSREFDSSGKNRCKINGRTVPLGAYRDALQNLAGIHGQNDSLSLLSPSMHLSYLDSFGGTEGLLADYTAEYRNLVQLKNQISDLMADEKEQERLAELYKMQLDDIGALRLKKGEDGYLEDRLARLKDAEKISKHAKYIVRTLYRSEKGVPASELCRRAAASVEALGKYFPDGGKYIEMLEKMAYGMEEIALTAEDLAGNGGEDPGAELDRVQDRLDRISRLKRKYGDTVDEILAYRDEITGKLDKIKNRDRELGALSEKLAEAERRAEASGIRLSDARKKAAGELEKELVNELKYLEMPAVRFRVGFKRLTDESGRTGFSKDGIDEICFLFSANTGEELRPLAEIASGGELARVMLSLRTMGSGNGDTLIFDEIDTGVSGKTSHKIGLRLKKLAEKNQVICVTHSAQIAACADTHLLMEKSEINGRTETTVSSLDREGRINELSRIMGGVNITDNVRKSAAELLDDNTTLN